MKRQISLILAAVIILSAVCVVFSSCKSKEASFYDSVVCETEDFKVTAPMMSYFFMTQYSNHSSYLEMLGIDPQVSLKEQECPLLRTGVGTWFTYFIEITKGHVTEILALCQTAHDNGVELDDSDRKNVDAYVDEVKKAAKSKGYEFDRYISLVVGNPMREEDLRACLELEILAEKYSLVYESTLVYSDAEIEAHYNANVEDFSVVDVYAFTVNNTVGEEEKIRTAMETIATAKTVAEYKAYVKAFLGATENLTEAEIDEAVASCYYAGATKGDFYLSGDWAFSAKAGDTYVETAENGFTVFMLAKEPYRNEAATRTLRNVYISSENKDGGDKAALLYSEWEKAGFSEDYIISIAKQHSDDTSTASNGGLLNNVIPGTVVAEVNEWLFDGTRKPGDCACLVSSAGWHLVYYVGEGTMPAWKSMVNSALAQEGYDKLVADYVKSIVYHEDVIAKIEG